MKKKQLIEVLNNIYSSLSVSEETQKKIKLFTKKEAIKNGLDEDVSGFSEYNYQFVLIFEENSELIEYPGYYFVYGNQTIDEIQETFIEFLKEIDIV